MSEYIRSVPSDSSIAAHYDPLLKARKWFFVALMFVAVADVPASFGSIYIVSKTLLFVLSFGSLLLPIRSSAIVLAIITIACRDVVQTQGEMQAQGEIAIASIWHGGFGPIRPAWIVMGFACILAIRASATLYSRQVRHVILYFASIPVLTAIVYGIAEQQFDLAEAISDLKVPMFLLAGTIIFVRIFTSQSGAVAEMSSVFLGAIAARHVVDFGYWLLGIGSYFETVTRVSVDSTKGTVAFLLLFALAMIVERRHVLLAGIIVVGSSVLLIVFMTRGLWLSTALGTVLFLHIIGAKRSTIALVCMAIVAFGALQVISFVKPRTMTLALQRLMPKTAGAGNVFKSFDWGRYTEVINSTSTTLKRGAVLWGSGYGSYYSESAMMFPDKMTDAFSHKSLATRRFYTIHNFVLIILFKFGILGLFLLLKLWITPAWACYKACRRIQRGDLPTFTIAILAFLPTAMLEITWSSKGLLLNGLVIAFLVAMSRGLVSNSMPNIRSI